MMILRPFRTSDLPRFLSVLVGAGTVLCFVSVAAAQLPLRVAFVDVNKVFKGYYKTKQADRQLTNERELFKKEVEDRMQTHHRLLEEIARCDKEIADPAKSAAAKADSQKKRDDKVEETHSLEQTLQDFKSNRDKQLQEQTVRVRNQIVEEIMVIVNERVATGHYDLVLNKSGQGLGGRHLVMYANESMEISDDVITALNKNQPTATSSVLPAAPATLLDP